MLYLYPNRRHNRRSNPNSQILFKFDSKSKLRIVFEFSFTFCCDPVKVVNIKDASNILIYLYKNHIFGGPYLFLLFYFLLMENNRPKIENLSFLNGPDLPTRPVLLVCPLPVTPRDPTGQPIAAFSPQPFPRAPPLLRLAARQRDSAQRRDGRSRPAIVASSTLPPGQGRHLESRRPLPR
jgi:hypothetical protein